MDMESDMGEGNMVRLKIIGSRSSSILLSGGLSAKGWPFRERIGKAFL